MKKILLYGIDQQRISTISGIASELSDELHVVKNQELSEKVIEILEKEAHPHFTEEPVRNLELCMFAGLTEREYSHS